MSPLKTTQLCSKIRTVPYYREILGVDKNASLEDVKKAFYKQSRQNHPDLFPDNKVKHQKYLNITEAYSALVEEIKTTSNVKKHDKFRGKTFGKGAFRKPASVNQSVAEIKVKTPLGFEREVARTSYQTGTFKSARDEYVDQQLKHLRTKKSGR